MIEYKIIRSDRKSISIQVTDVGQVIVRIPKRFPEYKVRGFVSSNSEWIIKAQEKQRLNLNQKIELTDEQISRLKRLAEKRIRDRVKYYSKIMGVEPTGIKITSAQKRFGSCNGKNSLCFSYLLMLYPDEAIDYVVVHELAHIKHHNHSKSFYNYVSEFLPDYKNREKLLKQKQKLPDFS